ncbi:PTS sugar transporter subunit IIB [Erysipelothrix larvae]|uniref:PTS sugar transporter subunit IIB n=1 Tax=Erysipelothrix larvae TaxID=1514105 RepID=A0A109UHA2_9FIRM|nr:PTS sugar transporter subunit IIB [Erysipelothrix larvae]AMC93958.1 PTS sugar transporter subunit IIB [Erysipelothrix larvae]
MEKVRILLCCGAGMSSGFLAQKARKSAKKRGIIASIEARSESEVSSYLSSIDILMIGPHYSNQLEKFQKMAEPYDLPVVVISQTIYASLDGDSLLNYALDIIDKK